MRDTIVIVPQHSQSKKRITNVLAINPGTFFLDVICERAFCTSPEMMLPKSKKTSML